MLLNDFFTIKDFKGENAPDGEGVGKTFRVTLELNARHRIFGGHFPGQPVVPGACLLQIVKEVTQLVLATERTLEKEWALVAEREMTINLRLGKADSLKFLVPIDPEKDNKLEILLTVLIKEEGRVTVSANLLNNESVCFKFNGMFQTVIPV